jgi:excisionase family DNA binding protein
VAGEGGDEYGDQDFHAESEGDADRDEDAVSDLPPILTTPEVAAWLKMHYTTVYRLVRAGRIPAFRIGSDWRFDSSKLKAWSEDWGK